MKKILFDQLKGGLVVSCQALAHEPLHGPQFMRAMAVAAAQAGALGLIANGSVDIAAIKERVSLPIIGVLTAEYSGSPVTLTPTIAEVDILARAAPEMIGIDATHRMRPGGQALAQLIALVRSRYPDLLLMAEIATVPEAIYVQSLGFDCISTAAYGSTDSTNNKTLSDDDFHQLSAIRRAVSHCPLVAEGGIKVPEHARRALQLGADFVVVGSAITRPQIITGLFVSVMNGIS